MKREVNSNDFQKIKENLAAGEAAVVEVPISAISVTEDTLKNGYILVKGKSVGVTPGFFKKLGSLLRINASLTKDMIDKGNTKIAAALINGLKDYAAINKKDTHVKLVANIKTREIIDIVPPNRYRRVTNETLFDVSERILNDDSNLVVETVDYDPRSGRASINFLNNNEVGFAQAGKDEFFKFGFSIVQTTRDTIVETYNQRLICTNGLRTSLGSGDIGGNSKIQFEDKFRLGGTGAEDIKIFLGRIEAMKKAEFIPGGFETAINKATSTKASLAEVEQAMWLSTKKLNDPDPELLKQYQASLGRKYFHGYGDTMARIHRKGVDPNTLATRQKQFIKSGMSIWDVVNSLTFLGSNNSGFPIDNQHDLKSKAGELFAKGVKDGFDLEYSQYALL